VSANREAAARIAALEAQVSALLAAREQDYDQILLLCEQLRDARGGSSEILGEILGVLTDIQKDHHRLSEVFSNHLDTR
jgi:hypothetical protein